ncbi:MAG: Eco57I restriction-modification methylase domain-containing protein [Thermoguttaceae bacterium]|jgi:methylase of polypeptide subunit release factors
MPISDDSVLHNSVFRDSVLRRYVAENRAPDSAWERYASFFLNPEVQENIRAQTEGQLQGEFTAKLFGEVLGYTLAPEKGYQIVREVKSMVGAKSADAAIFRNGAVFAVIELKDTRTTDLDQVETQAFGYKHAHRHVRFVITSNFERLRFYVDNTLDFIEFDLFRLTRNGFSLLWLILSKEAFLDRDLPALLYNESRSNELSITEKFYADYSAFKRELFNDILTRNGSGRPETDKILLFRKTQKLIDRFIFVLFCEDRGLLPLNTIESIIRRWRENRKWNQDEPLYALFRQYFGFINSGNSDLKIFAYNGGLFEPDPALDALRIDDGLLARHTQTMSNYDFATEVDVNILGHIFEHSLSDLEEISAALESGNAPTVSKRKKDGVFYTPPFITRYIVEHTVGSLCAEKKEQLGITDELFAPRPQGKRGGKAADAERRRLEALLERYRNWLLDLKICDPACGSGAFLVAALRFLISEHRKIDRWSANIQTGKNAFVFEDVDRSILERNLYGVDINEESVEIARLSLWLHTCRTGRKLNDLSDNIKCGNSLITEEFDWEREFPFGGFDVVLGNPPYVQLQTMGKMSDRYAQCGFEVYNKSADLYCLFAERGYKLLKEGGLLSFIMPNKWMLVDYGKPLRAFLAKSGLRRILNFGDIQFFKDATTNCCIFVTGKRERTDTVKALSVNQETWSGNFDAEVQKCFDCSASDFTEKEWIIIPRTRSEIIRKMKEVGKPLKAWAVTINYGIKTGYNDAFYIDTPTKERLIAEDPKSAEIIRPLLRGRDVSAYYGEWKGLWQITTHNGVKQTGLAPIDISNYPAVKTWLDRFYAKLQKRQDKGDTPYNLRNCVYMDDFNKPKIIYPNMTKYFPFSYDRDGFICNDKAFIITANDDSVPLTYLLALFNSRLAKLWIWYNCPELMGGTREIRKIYFENFPVPEAAPEEAAELAASAEKRIAPTRSLQTTRSKFHRSLLNHFEPLKITQALETFEKLDFKGFLKELKKQKAAPKLSEEAEWEEFFTASKNELLRLTGEIASVDTQIEAKVADLYGLSPEEAAEAATMFRAPHAFDS